jgi:GDP-L-fucose synthase
METKKMKIIVTGGNGLVGSALRSVKDEFGHEFIFATRKEVNLLDPASTREYFDLHKADCVIHTAARVGGIGMNIKTPAEQFTENILINTNVIDSAHRSGVKKLIAFSSVCAFPSTVSFLQEERLHDGLPYDAHQSYAYTKRMVDIQIQAYKKQYGVNYCSIIPGNIYGENDNYNIEDGHVIPSLMHKFFLAKKDNKPVTIWGDGLSYREFVYAKDLARICVLLLEKEVLPLRLLVSGEKEIQIKEIVKTMADVFKYDNIVWDTEKPNGQRRRPSDHTLFRAFFPDYKFEDFNKTLEIAIKWFQENYPNVRS